ncbi:response regulator transcription factor [Paenibacillus roseipurpureus]|uniref:Helix-turn-helix domain-containing protein n=1 Tax=Paenibacillus roseopurpureus TaxID=2918901 RepID=A0AA96RJD1_9BACL|nr:helix-turn-helix domain-containing protein [Paenibacillus sp. MBLB1832]WNR43041.1 helix-turn-helix domain-containing protein [Paenibacillus sp. MBLB1832]
MYNVFIVDDDVAVLDYLRECLPWADHGFVLAGAFHSPVSALQQYELLTPELVITDIGMPGMNGLELIKTIQEQGHLTKFLILSCHDDFRFAQQALQLGVQDYVLKESLEVDDEMAELLAKVKQQLDQERNLQKEVERLHHEAHKAKFPMKEKWLRDLLTGSSIEDSLWHNELESFGLVKGQGTVTPVVLRLNQMVGAISRYKHENTLSFAISNAIEEIVHANEEALFLGCFSPYVYMVFSCNVEHRQECEVRIEEITAQIQRKLSQFLKLKLSTLVGDVTGTREGLRHQLLRLQSDAEQCFYDQGAPYIRLHSPFPTLKDGEELFAVYFDYAEKLNRLLLSSTEPVSTLVDSFIEMVTRKRYHPKFVKQFLNKLILDLMMRVKFNPQYTMERVQHELGYIGDVEELREWLCFYFQQAVDIMDRISKTSKKTEIVKAQKYVQLRVEQKLSLEEVAEHLHLNASYFSRLFKKETGENFIEYVKRMKMEKAKELLSRPDQTVESVSVMLGYENRSYFVKVFREHYGMSPSQFMGE